MCEACPAVDAESHTDVLIVGAGPSGLMAAYWMARYGIRARIVDKRPTKVFTGHADGLRMRTLELFDSMGIQHRVDHEAQSAVDVNFWVPGEKGQLMRQGPITPGQAHHSPFHHMLLSQARIEDFILDSIREHSDIEVERGVIAESFHYDETLGEDPNAYPITVQLRRILDDPQEKGQGSQASHSTKPSGFDQSNVPPEDHNNLAEQNQKAHVPNETVRAKYIIGCDGAHSWTRGQLNIPFEGESTEHVWGVIDTIPITDFPDIRRLCTVTSPHGTILVIPREKQLVRLYVPVQIMDEENGRFDRSKITPEAIKARVQAILAPYKFDYQILDWWTAYQIGRRIAPSFSRWNRAFIAGDAVHTHSPKVGLGMNMSMQDGFNIGWKVALVVSGAADPCILQTYHEERHRLAELLLEFDKLWAGMFTQENKPAARGAQGKTESMMQVVEQFQDFADGIKAFYGESPLVCKQSGGVNLTTCNLIPGERVPPVKLRMQAEGNNVWTTRLFESNGQFKLVVLAGDVREVAQKQRLETLSAFLSRSEPPNSSLLTRYSSIRGRSKSLVDVLTVHSAPWPDTEFFHFPEALRPLDPVFGWSYGKIWCDDSCSWDRDCDGRAYEKMGS
ncbi:hypothetical protein N7470_007215 [Penicillium chermesinum]|nr:hypothetical protein N7470_007215 [Penicillium chermesinum]